MPSITKLTLAPRSLIKYELLYLLKSGRLEIGYNNPPALTIL